MNQYLLFRGVHVKKEETYTQISLEIEKRHPVQLPAW